MLWTTQQLFYLLMEILTLGLKDLPLQDDCFNVLFYNYAPLSDLAHPLNYERVFEGFLPCSRGPCPDMVPVVPPLGPQSV